MWWESSAIKAGEGVALWTLTNERPCTYIAAPSRARSICRRVPSSCNRSFLLFFLFQKRNNTVLLAMARSCEDSAGRICEDMGVVLLVEAGAHVRRVLSRRRVMRACGDWARSQSTPSTSSAKFSFKRKTPRGKTRHLPNQFAPEKTNRGIDPHSFGNNQCTNG